MYETEQHEHRSQIGATVFAVLAGLALLLLLSRCTPLWGKITGSTEEILGDQAGIAVAADSTSAVAVDPAIAAERDQLASQVDTLTSENSDLEDRLSDLEKDSKTASRKKAKGGDPQELEALNSNLQSSQNEATNLQQQLNAANTSKDAAVDDATEATANADSLAKENADLKAELEKKAALDAEIAKANADRDAAIKAARDAEQAKANALEAAEKAKAELRKANRDNKVDAATAAAAAAAIAPKLTPPNPEEKTKPEESKELFVRSDEDLAPKARALFGNLRTIHTGEGELATQPVNDAYTTASAESNAELLLRVSFNSGQSGIDKQTSDEISRVVGDFKEDDYVLVVGYADITGNDKTNRRIANGRAKSVADSINEATDSKAALQAGYIGSTSRFGDLSKNRVVEVWKFSK